ncbi:MAG: Crp/Fnr family transcriptional regulator [Bacteroidetes bacterium]|nr:MAG: Crp/Fnr family transcriptional regulator [Bacteroidota bacterium]
MQQLLHTLRQMISLSDVEAEGLLKDCEAKTVKKKTLLSQPGVVPQEIIFICKGLIRVMITDLEGVEHSTHFALENQFIADYASFIRQTPAAYALQALEDSEVVILPRSSIEWGYRHLQEGEKLGRLVAEYYFIYLDQRIINLYAKSPRERYDILSQIFPGIHDRVPQHMIASYLGITPVHLSRLKKAGRAKV